MGRSVLNPTQIHRERRTGIQHLGIHEASPLHEALGVATAGPRRLERPHIINKSVREDFDVSKGHAMVIRRPPADSRLDACLAVPRALGGLPLPGSSGKPLLPELSLALNAPDLAARHGLAECVYGLLNPLGSLVTLLLNLQNRPDRSPRTLYHSCETSPLQSSITASSSQHRAF
jgi:hypothetical protein